MRERKTNHFVVFFLIYFIYPLQYNVMITHTHTHTHTHAIILSLYIFVSAFCPPTRRIIAILYGEDLMVQRVVFFAVVFQ